ncbi:histidine phosphatase family protein [Halomonas binhaiensis]|uniref:Histidine phosphatase family protein n=1 Tax=Halomonas binhaiensis TaxID=2562282 RepID=A0A5C1NMI6_9GAMM|nr:histidine phosphatase family protein [Halomonas binhaiensis]QEM83627.1 histidine phosphatase family protein [Halomonas binhaiensis]
MSNTPSLDFAQLHNHYLLMRHGHSQGNAMGLIVSSPEHGLGGYGLSTKGQEQILVRLAEWHLAPPERVLYSDFLRTKETALRVAEHFDVPSAPEPRLRERFFGELDMLPDSAYQQVWDEDARNPDHTGGGVESVRQVANRLIEVIQELEKGYQQATLLLVSHGDPLQILLTAAAGHDLRSHREHFPLAPADIRPLIGH